MIKTTLVSFFIMASFQLAQADICMPDTEGFDEIGCTDLGGTVGVPFGNNGNPGGPSGVPLDGGVSLLLIMGASLGYKRLNRNHIKIKTEAENGLS